MAKLYSGEKQIATDSTPVDQELKKILGLERDTFTKSILSGQKELGALSETKGIERQKLVRKMVGLDNLDHIQQLVREDKNGLKNEIAGVEKLLMSTEQLEALKQRIAELKEEQEVQLKANTQLELTFKQKNKVYRDSQDLLDRQTAVLTQFNLLKDQLQESRNTETRLKTSLQEKLAQIKAIKEKQSHWEKRREEIKTYESLLLEVKKLESDQIHWQRRRELEAQLKHIIPELEGWKDLESRTEEHITNGKNKKEMLIESEKEIERIRGKLSELEKQASQITAKLEQLEKDRELRATELKGIQDLGRDAPCPTCFNPLLERYDRTVHGLNEKLSKIELEISTDTREKLKKKKNEILEHRQMETSVLDGHKRLNEELNELRVQVKQLQLDGKKKQEYLAQKMEIEKEISTIPKVDFDPDLLQKHRARIEVLSSGYQEYLSDKAKMAELPHLNVRVEKLESSLKLEQNRIEKKQEEIKKIDFDLEAFNALSLRTSKLEKDKDEAMEQWQYAQGKVSELQGVLSRQKESLEQHLRIERQAKEQKQEMDTLLALDLHLGDFKKYILERIRPTIAEVASRQFERITQGRYESIMVDEHFEFHIHDSEGWYPIQRFSGGEQDLANLCLRIAISQAIGELSGKSSAASFLGFDEIFGSQDEDRRHSILEALDLMKEQYRQIYVISHIESVKEFFPSILEVRRTATGSTAKWV